MKKFYQAFSLLLIVTMALQPLLLVSQSNQYLHFDKVDDFVQLPNGSQYFSGTNVLSMTGWFKCDALGYGQGYMGFRAGTGSAEFYLIQLNNGTMECRLKSTAGLFEVVAPTNTIIPQVWQHWAWIYDGTKVRLYVNGIQKGSKTASGTFQGTDVTFAIGKSILGEYNFIYGGGVDEVSVWNKALTQTEIQDIMANELTGTEANLQLYYKFNQGVPGGNNTSITKLVCEIGSGERDADLMNFAMTGETSNFIGTLDPGYQAISFPQIPNHLTTDQPFTISATATSGLPVSFEVLSGPATLDGSAVTLTGAEGQVSIRATQPGNGTFDPADPVINNFMVINPMLHVPDIEARHPLDGDVYVPQLSKILLSTYSTITYPELFSVSEVKFMINSETVPGQTFRNGHFVGWWTPPGYGNYIIAIISTNNFGASSQKSVSINVVPAATNASVVVAQDIWLNPNHTSETVVADLPSYLGAYSNISATLTLTCPPTGGCGEYDRVAWIEAKGHDGYWYEIIRYITPFGKACTHTADLTDYMSLLLGRTEFRLNCATLDNGYKYKLTLNYTAGIPVYPYSIVHEVWNAIYPFGDYANLQPVPVRTYTFPDDAVAAKMKLISTGHGWDPTKNTGNAAEFYNCTHHIWVNSVETFAQHNWNDCNPNPDGCEPQNGTYTANRAGWCPGSIAPWFGFDMTPYIAGQTVELKYVFYENYVDLCHPNHPNCQSGVTCPDCLDGFNPVLDVACNLVVFSQSPVLTGTDDQKSAASRYSIRPNPTNGAAEVYAYGHPEGQVFPLRLLTLTGTLVATFDWDGKSTRIDLSGLPKGMYLLEIRGGDRKEMKKIVKL